MPTESHQPSTPSFRDAIGMALLSTTLLALAFWGITLSQVLERQPAHEGVMTFRLSRGGELRLWNQPVRPQDISLLLERAATRARGPSGLVVRLIPDPEVPWGVTHRFLNELRPVASQQPWILQLQLP
ncbi:MAG: hypothetical protein ACK41W_18370 [Cyanobacteriota bacterium]|jgi:hypothetical protein